MMGLHGLYNFFRSTELLQDATTDFDVRTCDFMVKGFTNIVKKGTRLGDLNVCTEFFSNHAGDVSHLYGVHKNVLTIRRTEMETTQNKKDARIESDDSTFIGGLLTLFFDSFVDVFLRGPNGRRDDELDRMKKW